MIEVKILNVTVDPENNLAGAELAPPNDQLASALSQVEDDLTTEIEARRWAIDQLLDGATPESLYNEMIALGWESEPADRIIEIARKETRLQRGVLTREEVVRDLNVDYRRATGGLAVAFRSGLFGLYGFTTGFMTAMRSLRKLKDAATSKKIKSE